jgi:hypothetical protein
MDKPHLTAKQEEKRERTRRILRKVRENQHFKAKIANRRWSRNDHD